MTHPPGTAGLPSTPDPTPDQAQRPVPEGIAEVLSLVRILTAYGCLLATLIPHRTLWPGFLTVMRFLSAHSLSDTLTRIHRGIMRAIALERLLLKRAAGGRDLKVLAPRVRPSQPATEAEPAGKPASGPQYASNRVSDRRPIWIDHLPSMAEVEKEVRSRPIGRTLAAICLDLGISPWLCTAPFWRRLSHVMEALHGSVVHVMSELYRRETQFERQDWKYPRGLTPVARTPEAMRQALGFFIGEPPIDPLRPAAWPYPQPEPGTGPP